MLLPLLSSSFTQSQLIIILAQILQFPVHRFCCFTVGNIFQKREIVGSDGISIFGHINNYIEIFPYLVATGLRKELKQGFRYLKVLLIMFIEPELLQYNY